eukprot:m.462593 g.462593  ORF g.462593 m.462593 type:complete len:1011 (+) comp20351_c1_seq3:866-3898(+)
MHLHHVPAGRQRHVHLVVQQLHRCLQRRCCQHGRRCHGVCRLHDRARLALASIPRRRCCVWPCPASPGRHYPRVTGSVYVQNNEHLNTLDFLRGIEEATSVVVSGNTEIVETSLGSLNPSVPVVMSGNPLLCAGPCSVAALLVHQSFFGNFSKTALHDASATQGAAAVIGQLVGNATNASKPLEVAFALSPTNQSVLVVTLTTRSDASLEAMQALVSLLGQGTAIMDALAGLTEDSGASLVALGGPRRELDGSITVTVRAAALGTHVRWHSAASFPRYLVSLTDITSAGTAVTTTSKLISGAQQTVLRCCTDTHLDACIPAGRITEISVSGVGGDEWAVGRARVQVGLLKASRVLANATGQDGFVVSWSQPAQGLGQEVGYVVNVYPLTRCAGNNRGETYDHNGRVYCRGAGERLVPSQTQGHWQVTHGQPLGITVGGEAGCPWLVSSSGASEHCIAPWSAFLVEANPLATSTSTSCRVPASTVVVTDEAVPATAITFDTNPVVNTTSHSADLLFLEPTEPNGELIAVVCRITNSHTGEVTYVRVEPTRTSSTGLIHSFTASVSGLQPFSTYSMSLCGQTTAGPGPCSTPTAVTTDEDIGAMAPPRWVTAGGAKVVRWDLIDPAPGLVLWYELRSSQDFRLYLGRGFEYMLAPALNDIVTSMSVRVATRAGVGPWSPTAQRHASSASAASPWTLSLIGICLLSVALVAGTFLLARRKRFSTKATELWEAVDEWQLEPAWLEKTSRLGAGAFGEVFAGRFKHRKDAKWQCCAIKCCRPKSRRKDKDNLLREMALMTKFCSIYHPNIVQLLGVVTQSEPLQLVIEYCALGDAKELLRKYRPSRPTDPSRLSLALRMSLCAEIADGMQFLSSQGCVHRDLSARNILVNAKLIAKVADFGLSTAVATMNDYYNGDKQQHVPVRWMGPEIISGGKFTVQSDVFSFGVVMWEFMTFALLPFGEILDNAVVARLVVFGKRLNTPPCPEHFAVLMEQCFLTEPTKRPTFYELASSCGP